MYNLIVAFSLSSLVLLEASYLDKRSSVFLPYASECICATGVDPKKASDFIYHLKYPEDPCLKCFVKCTTIKIGYFSDNGQQQDLVTLKNAPEVTQDAIKNCKNITYMDTDLCEKMFAYSRCITDFLLKL